MNIFPLNNRLLGTIGLLGAPLMLIGMGLSKVIPGLEKTAFDGLNGLFFMLAWMGSLVGLIQLNATGDSLFGRLIIRANLGTLTLANCWNIYQAIEPGANTPLYWFLDAFWPISMITMLLVGITVARVGRLRGWHRYVPLAVGLWLPVTLLSLTLMGLPIFNSAANQSGENSYAMAFSGIYSAVCWSLMGYMVRTTPQPVEAMRVEAVLA